MIFIPPLSLYIHIPWCLKKCPYCDFNAYTLKNHDSQINYIQHLIQDLKNDVSIIKKRTIKTIFIGGGTPSILNNYLIKYLIQKIKTIVSIKKNTEITIEVNPENITIEKILKYQESGINRISFGIQTFNNKLLKLIGRNHTSKKIIILLNEIKKNIKINFNIDLIYGLPEQTLKNCLSDLEQAILINPNHISWYQLNIEKNTVFYYQKPNLPKDSIIWNMYNQGNSLLLQSQYQRYEISSYCKHNQFCFHNLNYWKFGDYIGIGCGSHSKITQKNGKIIRIIKKKRIYDYCNIRKIYIEKKYQIINQDKPFEYFMNIFRLFQPIQKKYFYLYTNLKIKYIKKNIKKAILKGYILKNNKYWKISKKGKNYLNNLLELFIII
ncbi:radical SAM family heme chaperone HemW [Buchnera aphidicola]|uniref:Heme chaperone HemW n=1 Tax=Buchnera aphidicola (Therioaphis trifolii) TaxID=1241884 RepID=A0A4D6YBK8_9GAMM|nr:radical SAM family heme chaperone HemW [Buchnera aphidicola]QCI27357.1 radical SAM family heme chaperone HemW [Buchnera aphidicola (Therioaphis trifolii)]